MNDNPLALVCQRLEACVSQAMQTGQQDDPRNSHLGLLFDRAIAHIETAEEAADTDKAGRNKAIVDAYCVVRVAEALVREMAVRDEGESRDSMDFFISGVRRAAARGEE